MKVKWMAAFAVLAIVSASAFAQNRLANPGFENGLTGWTVINPSGGGSTEIHSGNPFDTVPSGPLEGTNMAGWISGFDVSRDRAVLYQQFTQIPNGVVNFDLNAYAFAGTQFGGYFPTPGTFNAGVEFWYSPTGATTINATDPAAGGLVFLNAVWDHQSREARAAGGTGWLPVVESRPAGASATGTLFIVNRHQYTFFNVTLVDDLSVEAVPEPGPVGAIAAGLLSLGFLRRRR